MGQNLQDHIAAYGMTWITPGTGNAYNPFLYTADPRTYADWKLYRKGESFILKETKFKCNCFNFLFPGPLASPIGVEGNAFLKSKFADHSWPDIQVAFMSSHPGFDGGTTYKDFLKFNSEVAKGLK